MQRHIDQNKSVVAHAVCYCLKQDISHAWLQRPDMKMIEDDCDTRETEREREGEREKEREREREREIEREREGERERQRYIEILKDTCRGTLTKTKQLEQTWYVMMQTCRSDRQTCIN